MATSITSNNTKLLNSGLLVINAGISLIKAVKDLEKAVKDLEKAAIVLVAAVTAEQTIAAEATVAAEVGSVAGGIGAVIAAAVVLIQAFLDFFNPTLQDIEKELRDLYIAVIEDSVLHRMDEIDLAMSGTKTAYDNLRRLRDHPETTQDASININNCLLTLNGIFPVAPSDGLHAEITPLWFATFHLQMPLYYQSPPATYSTIGWSFGPRTCPLTFLSSPLPVADDNGYVFNYVGILPQYLKAIGIFLVVGGTLSQTFSHDRFDELQTHAQWLAMLHDTINSNIVCLIDGLLGLLRPGDGHLLSGGGLAGPAPQLIIVERYSGAYLPVAVLDNGSYPPNTQSYYARVLLKLYMGRIALYQQIGLDDVRSAANGLCDAAGVPHILSDVSLTSTSLRGVFKLVRDWETHVKDVYLEKLYSQPPPPTKFPTPPISLPPFTYPMTMSPWGSTVRSLQQMLSGSSASNPLSSVRAMFRG